MQNIQRYSKNVLFEKSLQRILKLHHIKKGFPVHKDGVYPERHLDNFEHHYHLCHCHGNQIMSRNQFSRFSFGQIGWRVLWIRQVCFTPYRRNVSKLRMPFKPGGRLLGDCEGLKLMHTVAHKGVFISHFPRWPLSLSGPVQKLVREFVPVHPTP